MDTVRIEDGAAVGMTRFTSIASVADLMTIAATRDGGAGFYVVPLESAEISEPVFAGAPMADADTRSVRLNVPLSDEHVVTEDEQLTQAIMFYSTAWFEVLASAVYLGAASRAIDEARAFARGMIRNDGTTLSAVDGAHVEIGRMVIALKSALSVARSVALTMRFTGNLVDDVNRVGEAAAIAKHTCTRTAEEIVGQARRFVGTRAMQPGSAIAELSGQVVFGQLHPKVAAIFERGMGKETLGSESFEGLD